MRIAGKAVWVVAVTALVAAGAGAHDYGSAPVSYFSYLDPAAHFASDQAYEYLGADRGGAPGVGDDGVTWSTTQWPHSADIAFTYDITFTDEHKYYLMTPEVLRIFVDWDRSGTWEDDEFAYEAQNMWAGIGTFSYPGSVHVPDDAALGDTWVQVTLSYAEAPGPPVWFWEWGEMENYNVTVTPELPPGALVALGMAPMGFTYCRTRIRANKQARRRRR